MPVPVKRDEALDLIVDSDLVRVVLNREGHFLFTHRKSLIEYEFETQFDLAISGYWLDIGHPMRITLETGEQWFLECNMEKVRDWILLRANGLK